MRFRRCHLTASLLILLIPFSGCRNKLTAELEEYMTVQEPVFSPAPDTYDDDMTIALGCGTSGADIHYTLDGSEPTRDSTLYKEPFSLQGDGSKILIFARAFHSDMDSSKEVNGQFIIQYPGPAAPVLNLSPGIFTSDIDAADNLTVSHDPYNLEPSRRWIQQGLDVEIHYTTDGSQPDESSPLYIPGTTPAFTVAGDGTQFILNAVSYTSGYKLSNAVTGIYTISYDSRVATPVISGTAPEIYLSVETTLSLSCATPSAEIYFTTDGSSPDESDSLYGAGIVIFPTGTASDGDTTTVRARAFLSGWKDSYEFGETYIFVGGTIAKPEFSLEAGSYSGTQSLELTTTTPDGVIYYTDDLTDPELSGTRQLYDGTPISLTSAASPVSIIAITEKNGNYSSAVSAVYTINAAPGAGPRDFGPLVPEGGSR